MSVECSSVATVCRARSPAFTEKDISVIAAEKPIDKHSRFLGVGRSA